MPKVEELKRCGNCVFFIPSEQHQCVKGHCHCNPPSVVSERGFGVFPLVQVSHWCGGFSRTWNRLLSKKKRS